MAADAVAILVAASLAGCSFRPSPTVTPLDASPALREQVASDFPAFEIVAAAGNSRTGENLDGQSDPGVTWQDILFTLRNKQKPFFLIESYVRSYRSADESGGWTRHLEKGEIDFAGTPDPHALSLLDFLVKRFPTGEFAFDQLAVQGAQTPDLEFVQAGLTPRSGGVTADGFLTKGHAELYVYDKSRRTWSVGN